MSVSGKKSYKKMTSYHVKNTLLVALFCSTLATMAEDEAGIWTDADGNPSPEVESQKVIDGFSGMLLVTSDSDWEEKWNTPVEHAPSFATTETVEVGGTVTTLIFFANPLVDDSGTAHIVCDIRVIRPDGSCSIDAKGVDCYSGPVEGDQFNVRLAGPVLGFLGEPSDQLGEYITEVTLVYSVRQVRLNLRTRFTLIGEES